MTPPDPLAAAGYAIRSPIAAGAFSQVNRAHHRGSGVDFAIKTFKTRKGGKQVPGMQAIERELAALRVLQAESHPNLANLIEVVESRQEVHAVLQYCGGGSLGRKLQMLKSRGEHFDEHGTAHVVAQVAAGLTCMHRMGVTHRDVKPENIVYSDSLMEVVKLVDFGFATCQQGRLNTTCGSPCYMAPELVKRVAYFGPPVDVWALGALAFELLHNSPAFKGESIAQLNGRIRKGSHEAFAPGLSQTMRAVVDAMLDTTASSRETAESVSRVLRANYALPAAVSDNSLPSVTHNVV